MINPCLVLELQRCSLEELEKSTIGKKASEGSTISALGVRSDIAAMAVHNSCNVGQPDSGSFIFFICVKALEDAKYLIEVFHVKPNSLI